MNIEADSGVSLFVQDIGEGRPVVLLPGLFMSHTVWDAQVCELMAHARTVCIDLRGHGQSSKPASGYDIARHISDVAAVLDDLDLMDVVLVGWSFGGGVAFGLVGQRRDANTVMGWDAMHSGLDRPRPGQPHPGGEGPRSADPRHPRSVVAHRGHPMAEQATAERLIGRIRRLRPFPSTGMPGGLQPPVARFRGRLTITTPPSGVRITS